VIGKILKKMGDTVALSETDALPSVGSFGLPGEYAAEFDLQKVRRILPYLHAGYDPMFIAKIIRLQ
jgi:hypothetical protein